MMRNFWSVFGVLVDDFINQTRMDREAALVEFVLHGFSPLQNYRDKMMEVGIDLSHRKDYSFPAL